MYLEVQVTYFMIPLDEDDYDCLNGDKLSEDIKDVWCGACNRVINVVDIQY